MMTLSVFVKLGEISHSISQHKLLFLSLKKEEFSRVSHTFWLSKTQ